MFKKISYTILTVAFLIGSYTIAHEIHPVVEITPGVSVSAGECEATASAYLSISGEGHLNQTTTWMGDGHASAGVIYLLKDDVIDRDPGEDNGDPQMGKIWLTVFVRTIADADLNISPSESTTTAGEGGVQVGIPKIGASVDGGGSVSQTTTSGTNIHIQAGLKKERTVDDKTLNARVTGNKRNGKWSYAYASFGGLSPSDCAAYVPSLLTLLNPFSSGSGS